MTKKLNISLTKRVNAFTLAEVLITLGIIGVVAAMTLPTLVTNIQERVRKEQVRTVKYKFTKATEKMNSLGKIGRYETTGKFVEELKNHLSIAKICDSGHLGECWSGTSFTNANGSKTYNVAELTTGKSLEALQFNSGDMDTVGIVTGDGTPIILTYGKECQALDETKQYTWSVVDGKPETNATTECISMVFDINGSKGPNKLGTDVRTMNSLLGMVDLGQNYSALSYEECQNLKNKLGINECCSSCDAQGGDYWAGAVKACIDLGMHLPNMGEFSQIAWLQYGVRLDYINDDVVFKEDCTTYTGIHKCKIKPNNYSSPITNFSGSFFSSTNRSNYYAYSRGFYENSTVFGTYRYINNLAICFAN